MMRLNSIIKKAVITMITVAIISTTIVNVRAEQGIVEEVGTVVLESLIGLLVESTFDYINYRYPVNSSIRDDIIVQIVTDEVNKYIKSIRV